MLPSSTLNSTLSSRRAEEPFMYEKMVELLQRHGQPHPRAPLEVVYTIWGPMAFFSQVGKSCPDG